MKLLLAEDEVDMSEALVDILTYHKYTVYLMGKKHSIMQQSANMTVSFWIS